METLKTNIHKYLNNYDCLRSYFGGWPVLAKNQFKCESESEQIEILCLLAKHKEIDAYIHLNPTAAAK